MQVGIKGLLPSSPHPQFRFQLKLLPGHVRAPTGRLSHFFPNRETGPVCATQLCPTFNDGLAQLSFRSTGQAGSHPLPPSANVDHGLSHARRALLPPSIIMENAHRRAITMHNSNTIGSSLVVRATCNKTDQPNMDGRGRSDVRRDCFDWRGLDWCSNSLPSSLALSLTVPASSGLICQPCLTHSLVATGADCFRGARAVTRPSMGKCGGGCSK